MKAAFIDNIASIYCIGIDVWKYWGYDLWIFGSIFYGHNVVVNDTYYMCTKMGARTSLFLTSQRMPAVTDAIVRL